MRQICRYLAVALLAIGISVVNRPASAAGLAGDALSFDGGLDPIINGGDLGDFVHIPNNPNLFLLDMTIEAWVFIEDSPFLQIPVISKGEEQGNFTLSVIRDSLTSPAQLSFTYQIDDGFGNSSCCGSNLTVPFNEWVHVAATYEARTTTAAIYINGQKAGERIDAPFPSPSKSSIILPLLLGHAVFISAEPRFLVGIMDEVRIWHRARTAREIANDFNRLVDPNSQGLLANYHFDEGFIDGVADQNVFDSATKFEPDVSINGTLGFDLAVNVDDPDRVDSTAPILANLAECEFTGTELIEHCTDSQGQPIRAYTLGVGVGTDFGGPIEGFGDASCSCPGVQEPIGCSTDQDAPNACSPRGFEPQVFETHALEKVGQIGSSCTLLCYPFDGIRMCVELCLN